MASKLHDLIAHGRTLCPDFRLEVRPAWGSRHQFHRLEIRSHMRATLGLSEDLSDLTKPPMSKDYCLSVSHTQGCGGWASVPRPMTVGFDVEETARISLKAVERVCAPDEINACPNPLLLWPAKESFFKALWGSQPQVLSALKISRWVPLPSDIYQFFGQDPQAAIGFCLMESDFIYSFCLIKESVSS